MSTITKHDGRKQVVAPECSTWDAPLPQVDNTMVKALARAFRWKDMLEEGRFAIVNELAKAENMNASYVGHVLRPTLLAPDIVEEILDGRQPPGHAAAAAHAEGVPSRVAEAAAPHFLSVVHGNDSRRLWMSCILQSGTCTLISALKTLPWLGTRRCSSS
jgi:hypothetical protein